MANSDTGCSSSFERSKSDSGSSLSYSGGTHGMDIELLSDGEGSRSGNQTNNGLKYLSNWPPVNLEFHNLSYTVTDMNKGHKQILRQLNGQFRSHELTAIIGPSGSGKTTLLNLLAGFNNAKVSGEITVNHHPRDMRVFRKMSRYIMQNDILDPQFTTMESMMLAANLKLGNELSREQKLEVINEILDMLRLDKTVNTRAIRLSGGEKKRLSIALELVNNPPVVFLDEPTTGLDDLSCSQCVSLLQRIAHAGRTIVCSIHTPSAKIFGMFDKVYVLAEGQCIYQGSGSNIVPFVKEIGLECPRTYNPADFIIEVACREYGDQFHDKMVAAVENGNVYRWMPEMPVERKGDSNKSDTTSGASTLDELEQFEQEINVKLLKAKSSWWMQYKLLLCRMLTQMWREKSYIKLKFYMNIVLGLLVGGIYYDIGNDATKGLFNFGFGFTIIIAYLYLPLMPVLLQFPTEIKLLRREYFNQWYQLSSYYAAMICSKVPFLFLLAIIYLSMIYTMSSQPLELYRFVLLFIIAFLTAMTSDSLGLIISARFSIVNATFMGPVTAVPLILLSSYGIGFGKEVYISPYIRFLMSLSYLRHGLEGIVESLYGFGRPDTICPDTEIFCMYKKPQFMLVTLGFVDLNYMFSVCCLLGFYILFTVIAYLMIKMRLSVTSSSSLLVQYVMQFLTKNLNFTSYNY